MIDLNQGRGLVTPLELDRSARVRLSERARKHHAIVGSRLECGAREVSRKNVVARVATIVVNVRPSLPESRAVVLRDSGCIVR